MAKKKSMPGSSTPFLAAVMLIIVAGGVAVWMASSSNVPVKKDINLSAPEPKPYHSVPVKTTKKVDIFVTKIVKNDAQLVPIKRAIPSEVDPHKAALEALLATNQESLKPAKYLVPEGTRLLKLQIKNKTAYADFSKEIRDNFSGGSMNEALLVNAIIHTLTQFEDVKKVQIMVDGKVIESLGGHLDISQPIEGDSTLLGKGDAE